RDGAPFEPDSLAAEAFAGSVTLVADDVAAGTATVRVALSDTGKQRTAVWMRDVEGRDADPVTIAAWGAPVAEQWRDGIVYQVMLDRFRGPGGAWLASPENPGARAGGTLDGVTAALQDGSLSALGVSALWLSPVYQNPVEARLGRDDGQLYEGYHGYWPMQSRVVDPRLGGEAALHALVAEAHAQGIAVLLDLVPNHLYETNPRVAEGKVEGWFHEHAEPCVCGSATCPWSTFIGTCWFTEYLPDLRFEHPDVMATAVADALWWHETFDTDGFRIDAVPMMPRAATRRIAHALRQATAPRASAFTIGEIFTGAGRGGTEDLRYYLGPDGLDSAFDFPLMWALREVVAHGGSFTAIEESLGYSEQSLQGSGAEQQLGRMIGNHDVTRFASEIAGDAGGDPWADAPRQPDAAAVFERQRLALALVLTLPGLPVLYYGDEVGLAGAADPDNRRVMPDPEGLADTQRELLESVRRLAQLRRCLPALRRGSRRGVIGSATQYAFVRDADDGAPALVVVSTANDAVDVALSIPGTLPPGRYDDALGGPSLQVAAGDTTVSLPARGVAVFVPSGNACL
ncbi:MAG: alpha-amylase family glycosyl hydrolase, partial [Myxococcota bacterium]